MKINTFHIKTIILSLICILSLQVTLSSQELDFLSELKETLSSATIEEVEAKDHFTREFVIMLDQKLDHFGDNNDIFQQRIFLSHYSKSAPVVFVTEGYSARARHYELCEILQSNQIQVEYRYFGESKPDNYDYQFLNNNQAMEDLHMIRTIFGKIYKKEWISTGISKGGTTCLIYKSKYPDDVNVAVPYVAPMPYSQDDPRCDEAILTNGDADCRKRLENFQKHALASREYMIAQLDSSSRADSIFYTRVGTSAAFEYAVMEFTFSFWQWGHNCDRIQDSLSDKQVYDLLAEIVGFDFYSDKTCAYFEPAFYQFMKENGYYAFIHQPLLPGLKTLTVFNNRRFAPKDIDIDMDKDYLKKVRVWIYNHGDNILHIQGGNDPWGACGIVPSPDRDALLMVKENGSHFTRISSFDKMEQQLIYNKLSEWLEADVHPLERKE